MGTVLAVLFFTNMLNIYGQPLPQPFGQLTDCNGLSQAVCYNVEAAGICTTLAIGTGLATGYQLLDLNNTTEDFKKKQALRKQRTHDKTWLLDMIDAQDSE